MRCPLSDNNGQFLPQSPLITDYRTPLRASACIYCTMVTYGRNKYEIKYLYFNELMSFFHNSQLIGLFYMSHPQVLTGTCWLKVTLRDTSY